MASSGSPYSGQGTYPQYAMNSTRPGQYALYPNVKPAANGFDVQNENAYFVGDQINPRHGAVYHGFPQSASHNHQPPQRACAVAVPTPSFPANDSHGAVQPKTPRIPQSAPPLDYELLLLSMAEEYFTAAYGRGSIAGIIWRETEMKEYYKLITTGLGCLEALLKHFKLSPEREATVRLRYATIMYEETENAMQVEEALSKGISLADRHKFFDLKYNMQHLLSRTLFQTNARAALKFLDGISKDAEVYQHVAWVYAFRFLKVTMHLEMSSHQDISAALSQLRGIISMAEDYGDKAILAIATTMEALACLKDCNNLESLESAQRALAKVRSLQLDPAIGQLPQLVLLTAFVDLCSSVLQFDPAQAVQKMEVLQKTLEPAGQSQYWTANGSFAAPISLARMPSCQSRNGIVRREGDRSLVLMFNWMPKDDVYNVGCFLSGVAMAHKNSMDGHKAERILQEGISREAYAEKQADKLPRSAILAASQQLQREHLSTYMRLHLAFLHCGRSSWTSAAEHLTQINHTHPSWTTVPVPLLALKAYLTGTIAQGTGDLSTALSTYRSLPLPPTSTPHPTQPALDLSLLATLNSLLIIRPPHHPLRHLLPTLLGPLCHYAHNHPNRQIRAALHLVLATLPEKCPTILQTKASLQSALQFGKATHNNQLQCLVLSILFWKFFTGVVGEQAEKSAKASSALARKWGDRLWCIVGVGLEAETLEMQGRVGEAERLRRDGLEEIEGFPVGLRKALGGR